MKQKNSWEEKNIKYKLGSTKEKCKKKTKLFEVITQQFY